MEVSFRHIAFRGIIEKAGRSIEYGVYTQAVIDKQNKQIHKIH